MFHCWQKKNFFCSTEHKSKNIYTVLNIQKCWISLLKSSLFTSLVDEFSSSWLVHVFQWALIVLLSLLIYFFTHRRQTVSKSYYRKKKENQPKPLILASVIQIMCSLNNARFNYLKLIFLNELEIKDTTTLRSLP